MKNRVLKAILYLFVFTFAFNIKAENIDNAQVYTGIENPLVQQYFCVDSKTEHLVILDTAENKVVILKRNANRLDTVKSILVDMVRKRHDVEFIYRPKSVAIYDNNVIFLASNRDSSYIEVLSIKGKTVYVSPKFVGAATAFSYNPNAKKLYIAGVNANGFNLFDIDVSKGFQNIQIDTISNEKATYLNYSIPKKSEEMGKHDPDGIALTVIAMSTVFFALFIISAFLIGLAKSLNRIQQAKVAKISPKQSKQKIIEKVKKNDHISGDVYAAISAAIYMYNAELHDEESTVLTINKVSRIYSPWSSKINNMNVFSRK